MKIELSAGQEKKFCLADGYENYMTLAADSPQNGEGLVYKNQVLLADFCVFEEAEGYKRLLTRFDGADTIVEPGVWTVNFNGGTERVVCSLFENALYFDCANFDKKSASLVLLPSIDLAKKLDKGQAFASSVPVEISKPLVSELLQLTKVYGKVADRARVLSLEGPGELYISLEHSPSASTKAAARLLREKAFERRKKEIEGSLGKSSFSLQDQNSSQDQNGAGLYNRALEWTKFSSLQFLNKNKTRALWAGLPWFRDYWGRDIFVSVPGTLLFSGNIQDAQILFENFAAFQDTNPRSVTYGRLPNIYRASGDAIYNTADASLLFVREAFETARFSGDKKFLERLWPNVALALECDRTLRTDSAGFLLHGDADTWMDARIFGEKSFCPRGNRACDIQALWFTALLCGARIAEILGKESERATWEAAADKVKNSFLGKFYDGQKIADCLLRDEAADFRVRPNQLALLTIPKITGREFIPQEVAQKTARAAVQELLFPYGICSLSQNDKYFHPYHKTWEWHHEDAAYHNGAIWTWNAGTVIGALCEIGEQDFAWSYAQNVAAQVFDGPCAGSLASNLWAYPAEDGKVSFSGAYSSLRSDAEFLRAAWQCFLGLDVDLLENKIYLCPRLPAKWPEGRAEIALGAKNGFKLSIEWSAADGDNAREFTISAGSEKRGLELRAEFADGQKTLALSAEPQKIAGKIFSDPRGLEFAKPLCLEPDWKKPECLLQKNFLAEIALRQEFNPGHPSSLTAIRS